MPRKSGSPREIQIVARGNQTAEVMIYESVGKDVFGEGLTSKKFAMDLQALGQVREINVRINSSGGNVFDGLAIYNALKNHPATVIVDIDGVALSMASVIAMAGDVVRMASNALMMVHLPRGTTQGDASDITRFLSMLARAETSMVNAYMSKSGLDAASVRQMMARETWLDADEALAAGLIDEVTGEMAIAASVDPDIFPFSIPASLASRFSSPLSNEGFEMPYYAHQQSNNGSHGVPAQQPMPQSHQQAAPQQPIQSQYAPQDVYQQPYAQQPPQHYVPSQPPQQIHQPQHAPPQLQSYHPPVPATLQELQAALPGVSAEFLISQLEVGATVSQAQATWNQGLMARLAETESRLAQLLAQSQAPPVPMPAPLAPQPQPQPTHQQPTAQQQVAPVAPMAEPVRSAVHRDGSSSVAPQLYADPRKSLRDKIESLQASGLTAMQAMDRIRREEPSLLLANGTPEASLAPVVQAR